MFGLPEWAIGVSVIIFCIPAAIVLLRLVHPLLPPPPSRPGEGDPLEGSRLLEDVQARLGELDQLKGRIDELEERVDFAERLLAKEREDQRLPPPRD
jgi:hypothetical protein